MSTSFQANVYQGSNKLGLIIVFASLILTMVSFLLLSYSLIPLIICSLILLHSIFHLLIKNLMTFKATNETSLIVSKKHVIFKTGDAIHWTIPLDSIELVDIEQKKYSLIFQTTDDDSYSINDYCFDHQTATSIQSLIKSHQ